MNIKKLLPILFLLISCTFYAQGERFREKKEQIRTMKVAFLTTELDLSPSEAEKFWPLYNAFDDKQFELRHLKMKAYINRIDDGSLDKMSEKDANAFLNQMESTEEELFLLRKKFVSNLKGILPSVKIIKLRKSEEDFNRKLLQQYRDRGPRK
ncbi:sensor of ECF-type sigma factor [Flavobacterium restrictum]|uniref:Sensor of ECF-type sigma factor n=1 Tax=Flavobacterium restrictum TaxID=2594428 RepID=A0A553DXV7_9FLAO|nr:sensor of ECF-type sigma factor [Flavobacterium restrictum]TRX37522.1 sensor of ECF-type sigma factor [Flavobacterium restrictum]